MPVADRRRAILDAVIPLLIQKGSALTTAEIAHAADIAEGTIFRAFPDKSAVIFEALKAAMAPEPIVGAIRSISPAAPLKSQLTEAARVLLEHVNRMMALGGSMRSVAALRGNRQRDVSRSIRESASAISTALEALFVRRRAELRVAPSEAVAALRGLVAASANPLLSPDQRLTFDAIVNILLFGVAKRD